MTGHRKRVLRFLGLGIPKVDSEDGPFLRSAAGSNSEYHTAPSTPLPAELSPSTTSPGGSSPGTPSPVTSLLGTPSPSRSSPNTSPSKSPGTPTGGPSQIQNVSFTDSPVHLELDLRPPSYDTVMNAGRRPQSTLVVQNNTSNDSLPHPSGQQFRGGQRPRVNSTPQSNTQYMRAPLPPVPTSRARAPTIHITAPAEPIHPNAIQEGSSPLLSASPPRIPLPQPPAAGTLRQPPLTPLNPVRRSRAQSAVAPGSSSRPVGARNPDSSNRREMGGIYSNTFLYLKSVASNARHSRAMSGLNDFRSTTRNLTTVEYLVYASRHRETLDQIAADLKVLNYPQLQAELEKDQTAITNTLLHVLYSPADEQIVLSLQEEAAQSLLDILQHSTLDHAVVSSREATGKVHRLMGKLSEKCNRLPKSLLISGVTQRDEHISFPGGYGDVFKASYQGKPVALKRMRMFQDTDQRDIRRRFCREALVWQRLRNFYIVPLIGIDAESFPPFLCLVSPWMKNGTVLKYLSTLGDHGRQHTVTRLIREIAQGLAFLHDEHVVHGDLRGANILVDDAGHACLTDFGLTIVNDASTAQTKNSGGCVRWMAPETLDPDTFGVQNRPRTPASDIYAFGCVCLELYTGYPPFHDAHLREPAVIYQVVQGVRPNRPAGNSIPDYMWNIMQKCWAHNFADRPSILGILLELGLHDRPSDESLRIDTGVIPGRGGQTSPRNTSPQVTAALTPFSGFIDPSNPQEYYIRREKIAEGSDGMRLCVARLANVSTEHLMLPSHIKEQDRLDRLAHRPTFVAIKTVPITPSGNATLSEVLRELCIMRDLRCKNIVTMDALYVDPVEDTLWIRMELMIRPLSSVIELRRVGLTLPDRTIAGCIKDVLNALEYLRMNDVAPRNIRSNNIMINNQGVLKLTNLSTAVRLSTSSSSNSKAYQVAIPPSTNIASNACSLGALVWEMATGEHRSINAQEDLEERPLSIPTFHEFIQMCFDLEDWSPLSSIASRTSVFRQFIKMCFDPAVTSSGYQQLLESPFIRDACERMTLAQLLMQCAAFQSAMRQH